MRRAQSTLPTGQRLGRSAAGLVVAPIGFIGVAASSTVSDAIPFLLLMLLGVAVAVSGVSGVRFPLARLVRIVPARVPPPRARASRARSD